MIERDTIEKGIDYDEMFIYDDCLNNKHRWSYKVTTSYGDMEEGTVTCIICKEGRKFSGGKTYKHPYWNRTISDKISQKSYLLEDRKKVMIKEWEKLIQI